MTFTRLEKIFIFCSLICGALICGEYAMTRPSSNALFVTVFTSKAFPYVWLATVPFNFGVIYLYNRFLPKIGPLRMLLTFASLAILVNALTGFFYKTIPQIIFFQYIWKDIYVLLMLKQLWSMIHSTIPSTRAKYLYGCIYGMGTIGAISGSMIPSFFASSLGSEKILLFTLPVYLFLMFIYTMAYRRSGVNRTDFRKDLSDDPRPKEALSLIKRSPVLIGILLLVVFMQISVGLMEYRFNAHLEMNILDTDLRTAYWGRIVGLLNIFSLVFQFLGALLVVKTIGLRKSHYLVPTLLCISAIGSLVHPVFGMITFSYIFLKSIDFSLFGVIREMLYVPLKLDEKYRAKAIIDVFAYRTSKAVVSVVLLSVQAVAGSYLLELTGYISIAVFIGWLLTIGMLFKRREAFSEI